MIYAKPRVEAISTAPQPRHCVPASLQWDEREVKNFPERQRFLKAGYWTRKILGAYVVVTYRSMPPGLSEFQPRAKTSR